ncbi:MAG: DUF488 domain-containing protein [Muribaculaceae bacterium]|nr:DUF488 domain-containing protein [Muribaculaceae bacterium]
MRFYREKCLAALMEQFGDWMPSIQIQKLVFLLTDRQEERVYDFMPYKYGCYSMQLSQDLRNLTKEGILQFEEDGANNRYKIARNDLRIYNMIKVEDNYAIARIIKRFALLSVTDLIRYTYQNYPFFAINSKMAKDLLSEIEYSIVVKQRPHKNDMSLITIGYEGLSLEQYIVILLRNDVRVLCDVRKNAYSQKFGFSKAQLVKACEGVGIRYEHIPNLGIISEKRKELKNQTDYDKLFDEYESTTLKSARNELNHLYKLLQNDKRIALTCFEHNPLQCHRSRIAKKLMSISQCNYTLINL